jgi:hypothetical protein
MTACVVMHNMIVEAEHGDSVYDQGWDFQGELVAPNPGPTSSTTLSMHITIFEIGQPTTPSMKIWIRVGNNPKPKPCDFYLLHCSDI